MANRQNQCIQATESNQNTKQDSQQSEVNPVAVLLEWSDRKSMYALSVILAIIGVLGGMVSRSIITWCRTSNRPERKDIYGGEKKT